MSKINRWAVAIFASIALATSAEAAGSGDPIFTFNWLSGTVLNGSPPSGFIPRIQGTLLGTGGEFTGFNGSIISQDFGGLLRTVPVTGFFNFSGGYEEGPAGFYTLKPGNFNFGVVGDLNAYPSGTSWAYEYGFPDPGGSYNKSFWLTGEEQLQASYANVYDITQAGGMAVPEIDGSVLPRALLIVAGLLFLLIRTRGNGSSVESNQVSHI